MPFKGLDSPSLFKDIGPNKSILIIRKEWKSDCLKLRFINELFGGSKSLGTSSEILKCWFPTGILHFFLPIF